MLDNLNVHKVLFIDIETVPQHQCIEELDERERNLWNKKAQYVSQQGMDEEETYSRAGIYSEFGKIVCISAGHIFDEGDRRAFRVKSFYNDNEKTLLEEFNNTVSLFFRKKGWMICTHNGQEFDIPYIARRSIINKVALPKVFQIGGLKPWELGRHFIDTMQLWKFGDYKRYTSLELLCHVLDVPSPKNNIDGSEVNNVYWKEKDLKRIVEYCQLDILATANILLRYIGDAILHKDNLIES